MPLKSTSTSLNFNTPLNLPFMNFSTDDIISFINLCVTLEDEQKQSLILRMIDDLELHDGRMSQDLADELSDLWDFEQAYLENQLLPEWQAEEREVENQYQAELERIRPQLDRMVEEYQQDTQELITEYDKAFRQIDLEMDHVLQRETAQNDASQIEAIKAKLSKSSSTHEAERSATSNRFANSETSSSNNPS
jgi:hypothetical protein